MLKILFSPSEGKRQNSNHPPLSELLFGFDKRLEILNAYNDLVLSADKEALHKMFGLKKEEELKRYAKDIFNAPTCKAIERYEGVAYDYLNIASLDSKSLRYLEQQCIIFSNLFGPIKGGELIPDYKVKQGEDIGVVAPDVFYKRAFSADLDALLASDDILDLRAGYYDKFYKPSKPYTTLKFMKSGKVVSHWAKAYRGIVLRELAKSQINSLDAFNKLNIEGLHVREIKTIKLKTEIVFDIV
jgi:uncharacterized protein